MLKHALLVTALCGFSIPASAQYYYPAPPPQPYYKVAPVVPVVPVYPQPYYAPEPEPYSYPVPPQQYDAPPVTQYRSKYSSDLSRKCAMASEYIKHNNCGPQGCDVGYCIALQHGCRIRSWGHSCPR